MKNLKLLTLLGIILITGTLAGCFRNNDSDKEDQNNDIENTAKGNDPLSIYYNSLMDIAAKCLDSEQEISDTYNNPSSSIIDVQFAISKTLNLCLDASEEIQTQEDREGDSSLNKGILNVLEKTVDYYSKFSEFISYEENNTIEESSTEEIEDLTEEAEDITQENASYINISNELNVLKEELDIATKELAAIQEEFANVHGLTLK